ncbi:MAG: HlyD family efflux transporter periplasmic adaptor subunit, partial [Undibacterium sp.]|nr:HlyD family efflux transporter periplasmic adaptor subunit [Undibacterium sp.]
MLFRKQAVEYQTQGSAEGHILLRSPKMFWFFSVSSLFLCLVLILLLIRGHHTQRAHISGHLVWNKSALVIRAPIAGLIQAIKVDESAQVKLQQALFDISVLKNNYEITSPSTGQIELIQVNVGQNVDKDQILAQLIPADAQLQAEMYAPSTAIAYIKAGQKVSLRYGAFPYQKFGQFNGVVKQVSRMAQN